MPSASQETEDEFYKYFGHAASDTEAHEYLHSKGIRDSRGGVFDWQELKDLNDMKAWSAVQYLCEEWDYACE